MRNRGKTCNPNDSNCLYHRQRPGGRWPCRESRPAWGNLTGVSILAVELVPKRLELLSELVPQARSFGLLINPTNGYSEPMTREVQAAAGARGVQLKVL